MDVTIVLSASVNKQLMLRDISNAFNKNISKLYGLTMFRKSYNITYITDILFEINITQKGIRKQEFSCHWIVILKITFPIFSFFDRLISVVGLAWELWYGKKKIPYEFLVNSHYSFYEIFYRWNKLNIIYNIYVLTY